MSMKINLNEQTKENIKAYTLSGIFIVITFFIFKNISIILKFLSSFWNTLMPFVLGFAFAFILIPLRRFIENDLFKKLSWTKKTKRNVSVCITMIVFAIVIASFFIVLIPQLISSAKTLISSFDGYVNTFTSFFEQFEIQEEYRTIFDGLIAALESFVNSLVSGEKNVISTIVSYSVSFISSVFNVFIALIITIYLLVDEERFKNQVSRVIRAVFGKTISKNIFYVSNLTSKMFNSFIFGKAFDSLIIGIICWIGTALLHMPYATLISFIVGLTNMIPVFGPFIGAVPCIFILLFISPIKALEFTIFVFALQQVDGNIIGPKILGDSLGLPALWVMFAIIVGGGLFGILGMFFGVPLFSVIYVLIRDSVNKKLKEEEENGSD